jgi:hypothetical protein
LLAHTINKEGLAETKYVNVVVEAEQLVPMHQQLG